MELPKHMAEHVEAIRLVMQDHCTDEVTTDIALLRLIAIGCEEWDRFLKADQ